MSRFQPLFRNPHVQTIAGHFWPRPPAGRKMARRLFSTEPGVEVLVESERPPGAASGEIVMIHGLEGSGEAGYIRSLSAAALKGGYAAHCFHMRTCGGTERLSNTLYHAGLTGDLLAVLRRFREEGRAPAFLVGFSLGGNVALKLAGELAERAAALIRGVCAVSTPLDLDACSRRLALRENHIYEARFVRRMRARLRDTGRYEPSTLAALRTLREIDDRITAPSFGFGDAGRYYSTQSSLLFVPFIRVPALLIQAKDDPIVPFDSFETDAVRSNPAIELRATRHGGHLGFLARGPRRFWADDAIMEWIGTKSYETPSSIV